MYYQPSTNMNMPTQARMNQSVPPDPVTRAVVDNIIGKFPTKTPRVRCNDCNLDFTSQVVLDAHLQGARHAKQIRSKTIMETLERTNIAFSKDEITNGLKCNPCNVLLNSIQQLQTHLNGNRHKKKIAKGDWHGKEIVSKSDVILSQPNYTQPSAQPNLLSCPPCNKFFNSTSQLNVHLTSQKHSDKVNNTSNTNPKKRFFPYWKKDQTINSTMNRTTTMPQILSNNFVSTGYQQFSF